MKANFDITNWDKPYGCSFKVIDKQLTVNGCDCILIRVVKCDNWEVLYINGDKKYEDHKIELDSELFNCINSNINDRIARIDFDSLWVTNEYMEDVGCPDKFSDIPEDVTIKKYVKL